MDRAAMNVELDALQERIAAIFAAREAGTDWADIAQLDGEDGEERTAEQRSEAFDAMYVRAEELHDLIAQHDAAAEQQERDAEEAETRRQRHERAMRQAPAAPRPRAPQSNDSPGTARTTPNEQVTRSRTNGNGGGTNGSVSGSRSPASHERDARLTSVGHIIGDEIGPDWWSSGEGRSRVHNRTFEIPVEEFNRSIGIRRFYDPADPVMLREERMFDEGGMPLLAGGRQQRAVDMTGVPTSLTQQIGIIADRAEFYAIGRLPMLMTSNAERGAGDQWNEDDLVAAKPALSMGETGVASQYSPRTIKRTMYPQDGRTEIKVTERSLETRPDWETYLNFRLMTRFYEALSPEAIYTANNLDNLVAVGNAAFHQSTTAADPVSNPMNGITKKDYSISHMIDSIPRKGVAIADAVGEVLDDMAEHAPGMKRIICNRAFASAYRRDLGDALGVALQRSGNFMLDIEGAPLEPVDVGFPSEGNNALQAVISDFAASTEVVITKMEIQVRTETYADTGEIGFLLKIGRTYRYDSRFLYGLVFAKS